MTKYMGKDLRIYFGAAVIGPIVAALNPIRERELHQYAVLDGIGGYHYLPGLAKDSLTIDGIFNDSYTAQIDALWSGSAESHQTIIELGSAIGVMALATNAAKLKKYEHKAVVTDINKLSLELLSENLPWDECLVLHPEGEETADGGTTAIDQGAYTNRQSSLTANPAAAQKIVTVASTSIFKTGDTVHLYDDDTAAESNTISSIDSATQVTLTNNIVGTFTMAQNGVLRVANGSVGYLQLWGLDSDSTLTIKIQESSDNGQADAWADIITFTTIDGAVASSGVERKTSSGFPERYIRVYHDFGGGAPHSGYYTCVWKRL